MKKLLMIILALSILSCNNKNNQNIQYINQGNNETINYYNVIYLANTNSGEYVNAEISYDNTNNLGYIIYSDTNQDTVLYNIEKIGEIDEGSIYAKSTDNRILEGNLPSISYTFKAKIDGMEHYFNTVNTNIKEINIIEYSFSDTSTNNKEDRSFNYKNSIFIIKNDKNDNIINKINMDINKHFNIKDVSILNDDSKRNDIYTYIKRDMENEYNIWNNEQNIYNMEILANRYAIDYISDDIISINNFVYKYSGGAHGNYSTIYKVYSLKTGDKINIEDIIIDVNNQDLINIIKQKLLQIRDNKLYFNLDDISLEGNNFYITAKGIVFTWGIYEIAPYSEGETRILLSKNEINNFLKEEYKSIIK